MKLANVFTVTFLLLFGAIATNVNGQISLFIGVGVNHSNVRNTTGFSGSFSAKYGPVLELGAQYRFEKMDKLALELAISNQMEGYEYTVSNQVSEVSLLYHQLGLTGRYFLHKDVSVETGLAYKIMGSAQVDFPRALPDVGSSFRNDFAVHGGFRFFESHRFSAGLRYSHGLRNILQTAAINADGQIAEVVSLKSHFIQINLRYSFKI